ncbi:PREDICTED: uncharacterized protein LOC108768203 [Trachymyrmex cornetzi]|uniref:uncharacterized protein LOC108768203 n=1 Tax=Trachymyrmex cornetzi TaxID=471704 RepID=UPI00084EE659|nr:PREDICTED: uncharacterized protein LOC108768203 [Trachymyrmex cornetzi]
MDKRLRSTYRCSTRRITGCRELAVVSEDDKVTVKTLHDHPPNHVRIQKYALQQEMLHLSQVTLLTSKDIFDDVSLRNPETAAFFAFKSIRSRLNRERTKNRPKLPQSIRLQCQCGIDSKLERQRTRPSRVPAGPVQQQHQQQQQTPPRRGRAVLLDGTDFWRMRIQCRLINVPNH